MTTLFAFTDGSSRGNPGPGGFGAILLDSGKSWVDEFGGSSKRTTNNEMELLAVVVILRKLSSMTSPVPATLYSDSSYVVQGASAWVHGWKKRGWKTATNGDIANLDLWQELEQLQKGLKITYVHIRGHVGIEGNERCDQIATEFADNNASALYNGAASGYSLYSKLLYSHEHGMTPDAAMLGKRESSTKKSAPKNGWYLSLVDGVAKRHELWEECKARVHGVSARYKKVSTRAEEDRIAQEWKCTFS
jgi:ribonuclease HI